MDFMEPRWVYFLSFTTKKVFLRTCINYSGMNRRIWGHSIVVNDGNQTTVSARTHDDGFPPAEKRGEKTTREEEPIVSNSGF